MWASLLSNNALAGRSGDLPGSNRGCEPPMMIPAALGALLGAVALLAAGCRLLPAPYLADASGPVCTVRVLDAQSGADIPEAQAWVQTGLSGWPGTRQPQLLLLDPDAPDAKQLMESRPIERNKDASFSVSKRLIIGLVSLGYARRNPATATIAVSAPGYPLAAIKYCAAQPPWPGWSASRSLAQHLPVAGYDHSATRLETGEEIARCRCDEGGQVTFYLRRLTPEMAAAIRNPGGVSAVADQKLSPPACCPERLAEDDPAGCAVSPWPREAAIPASYHQAGSAAGLPPRR
jgi:hypothetical protein